MACEAIPIFRENLEDLAPPVLKTLQSEDGYSVLIQEHNGITKVLQVIKNFPVENAASDPTYGDHSGNGAY